jgi:hypothetical protein
LIDPERLAWELSIIGIYAECAAKHAANTQP